MRVNDLVSNVEHFRARVLNDALLNGSAIYWRRRAEAFDWAAPRPDDFTGNATPQEIEDRARRCRATAEACRRHAHLLLGSRGADIEPVVWTALEEVA